MAAIGRHSAGGGRGKGEGEIETIRSRDNVARVAIERRLAKLEDAAALIQRVAGSEDMRFPVSMFSLIKIDSGSGFFRLSSPSSPSSSSIFLFLLAFSYLPSCFCLYRRIVLFRPVSLDPFNSEVLSQQRFGSASLASRPPTSSFIRIWDRQLDYIRCWCTRRSICADCNQPTLQYAVGFPDIISDNKIHTFS